MINDIEEGQTVLVQGSAKKPYELKNVGGVYSCSCVAWRMQSKPIDKRSCKHLAKLRGAKVEATRTDMNEVDFVTATAQAVAKIQKEADAAQAPPILLAHKWDGEQDLTGWWVSEKLDGVRAYWDGKRFLSRLGNEYHAPDWFKAGLPDTPLDGELWLGRKQFQECVSIVRRQDAGKEWEKITYLVFDAPAETTNGRPSMFEERWNRVVNHFIGRPSKYARAVDHQRCGSPDDLRDALITIERKGAEGLMCRAPGSAYEVGRSETLLKVKSFKDCEARVVGHEPGKGKHKGRLGALVCELEDGTEFNVGTGFSDAQRAAPPAIGSIVTVKYQELSTGGVPRFPSFAGTRFDAAFKKGARR